MNILIACEESGRVTEEFRKKGHNAFSCDILPTSGIHPEWHIMGDVLPLLNGQCNFKTNSDVIYFIEKWDIIIAFPPCTHLAVSGARHFEKKRKDGRQLEAIKLFADILNSDCEKIVVENPVNIIGSDYIDKHFPSFSWLPGCTQYIQPYEYGEPFRKKTCLWIKGLPLLKPTNIVEPKLVTYTRADGTKTTFSADYGFCKSGGERSKTYLGIAKAMAEQWG